VTRKFPIRALVRALLILFVAVGVARYGPVRRFVAQHAPVWGARGTVQARSDFAAQVVAGARAQIGTLYDASYLRISYPGGDVPSDRGACSDVVVRALRHAGVDLQRLIHEDMLRDGAAYSRPDAGAEPDANIDHRRCVNQMSFFGRHGGTLTIEATEKTREDWQPGDFVYWRLPDQRLHVGVLSDRSDANSLPLVIHNGGVCREQDCLTDWEIFGHFRYASE
jgi:uncharacterized protein YijF (DUF1287 family)